MLDCSLRSRGSRFGAAAFLTHSQTKSVSARSFVQDSGARDPERACDPPTSSSLAEEKHLCSLLLSTAGARLPTLAANEPELLAQCLIARSAREDRALEPPSSLTHRRKACLLVRSSRTAARAILSALVIRRLWPATPISTGTHVYVRS
jgi:hypothetical protein